VEVACENPNVTFYTCFNHGQEEAPQLQEQAANQTFMNDNYKTALDIECEPDE